MPDPSANPYLALAVMLAAGLDGIETKADHREPVDTNIFDMSFREKRRLRIDDLPHDLNEACDELEKDALILAALGEHVAKHFLDAKRQELGVDEAMRDVPGVTTAMMVRLGENGVKTVEDLAGCATDDLTGWTERKDGEAKREPGFLDGLNVSREDAEAMIMQARVKAGWITEAELAPPVEEAVAETAEAAEPQASGA